MDLRGPRVRLRQWTDDDIESLAALNADPAVMEFFPQHLSRAQSLALHDRLSRGIAERGWGLWAVEIDGHLAGFTGLAEPSFTARFTPCVEIGWRFHHAYWGHGYALEAARVAALFAFETLRLSEVVSFTARLNRRSERVMQRLGMARSPVEDFEHPLIPAGDPLRLHVLYRLKNTPEQVVALKQQLAESQTGMA